MWKAIKDYFKAFKVLGECPREIWIVYGLTFFDCLAYFTLSYVLIKYLTDNYGFSDVAAGWIYGAWTMLISVVIFFVGAFTDSIGIKRALLVGLVLLVISRGLMGFVPALPDNQMEFGAEHIIHEWNVTSYAHKVPKGQKQPKPFPRPEENWTIEKDGDGIVIKNPSGESFKSDIQTGHELVCFDRTNYSEKEKGQKPDLLSKLIFSSPDGMKKGEIQFSGKLRTLDGETRTAWESNDAKGVWQSHPNLKGKSLDLTQKGWVIVKYKDSKLEKIHEEGYIQSLVSLTKAIIAGRKVKDRSNMKLNGLRLKDPEGGSYSVTFSCVAAAMPEGTLGRKLRFRAADREYSEVVLKNQEGAKKGKLDFTGILTDVHGHEVTMWKINTARMMWEEHPTLAGAYLPDNLPKDEAKPLPKMFFWSKGNSSAMGALIVGLFILGFGTALMSPVILTAKKYYTNSRTRTIVFMGYYLMVNVAAMFSGIVVDILRLPFGNQSIFVFGFFMVLVSYVLVQFLLREGVDEEEKERIENLKKQQAQGEEIDPKEFEDRRVKRPEKLEFLPVIKDIGGKLYTVSRQSNFWRYVLFLVIILGVRLVFTHWFMVMPKYYTRVLGEGVPIGTLNMINPFLISIGLIVAVPFINRIKIFPCFILGTSISAVSMVFLMIPGDKWSVIGLDMWQGYFLSIILQIMVFSVGEVIWSPRTAEYAANIAPRGHVGTYMSLASLLLFISKPLNGVLSGWFLRDYCPEGTYEKLYYEGGFDYWDGPEVMWVIYGLIAIASPILLVLLRNVIQAKEKGEEVLKKEKVGV